VSRVELFETHWGWMTLGWRNGKLFRVGLPTERDRAAAHARELLIEVWEGARSDVARDLVRYFEGKIVRFSAPLQYPPASLFRRRVWDLTAGVPYGAVTTYGELARRAGKPGAARAVGGAMAANPLPLVVPCHRVLAAGGKLGGFSGGEGVELKRRLLRLEGVRLDG